ncbi:hypothetical protein EMCG_01173 [[Emmonsia] crescens]|uniref:Ferric reductase NAD binding domain-containing protein n=1 Tax=[Emmonsia] crescens TaxID=73230 RepID=A0A0G2I5S0_9EURO|nr:hypothetical protein EMCG_01173 [Emmonsia crescens UAMH 3008]
MAKNSLFSRAWGAVSAGVRRHLLKPEESLTRYFGHVTRLQVAFLCGILAYLFIFALVGIVYKSWVTSVKQSTSFNIRTPLGPMANRVGAFAYALTPLTVVLSTRENVLSLITKIPRPKVYAKFIAEKYVVFGILAQVLIAFIYIFNIKRVVMWTGHAFFRKSHYIPGILSLGTCWGHWARLACWIGFKAAEGKITSFDDGDGGLVARLEFSHDQPPWKAGQHFFLCLPEITVWQSHPFTPFPNRLQSHAQHAYIIRCLKGETSRPPLLGETATTPVILTGPYRTPILDKTAPNILAIAGGTGISFALPLAAAAAAAASPTNNEIPAHRVELVWVIPPSQNIEWVQDELNTLLHSYPKNVIVRIFISHESPPLELGAVDDTKGSAGDNEEKVTLRTIKRLSFMGPRHPQPRVSWFSDHHPDMRNIVQDFMANQPAPPPWSAVPTCRARVVASSPAEMGRDLRTAVTAANDTGQV